MYVTSLKYDNEVIAKVDTSQRWNGVKLTHLSVDCFVSTCANSCKSPSSGNILLYTCLYHVCVCYYKHQSNFLVVSLAKYCLFLNNAHGSIELIWTLHFLNLCSLFSRVFPGPLGASVTVAAWRWTFSSLLGRLCCMFEFEYTSISSQLHTHTHTPAVYIGSIPHQCKRLLYISIPNRIHTCTNVSLAWPHPTNILA